MTSTSQTHTYPIVGAHFRPPAKAILAVLPAGAPLRLRPEPDNPYDANACQVLVASADIPPAEHEELEREATQYGYDLAAILAAPAWHLGYIPSKDGTAATITPLIAAAIAQRDTCPEQSGPDRDWFPASLQFDAAGKPTVRFTIAQREG